MSSVPGKPIKTGALTATGTAAPLLTATPTGNVTPKRSNGAGVIVKALSTNASPVYVGGPDVTTANGLELEANEACAVPCDDPTRIYVVTGGSSLEVRFLYI